jgi:Peptidase family M28/PDZ domain/PA domain
MKRTPLRSAIAAGALLAGLAGAARASDADLHARVERLASDEMDGRLTGTAGARLAAEFLTAELRKVGVTPLPGHDGFAVPFEFTAGTLDAGSRLAVHGEGIDREWSGEESVRALSFSDNGEESGGVAFAGYGIVVPESQSFPYDSYAGIDVKGKIVLVLRYFPEDLDQAGRAVMARYSGLRYKALQAREHGAKALLVVTGPRSPNAGQTVPMSFDTAISGSGIVAASVSGAVGEQLFASVPGKDLEAAQKALDNGNPHIAGFEIPGVEVTVSASVTRETRTGTDLVGVLPGAAPDGADKRYVVIGAHYDHLGHGDGGNSLARGDEVGGIHHGADDNASGVAAVLEAAGQLAALDHRRDVVVALWSGEELGILGSTAFLKDAVIDPTQIAADVNLDMVGRLRDNKLSVQAAGSSDAWPGLLERVNVPLGFDLEVQNDPYLPTDSAAFNQASIPTLNLFTGSHEDYHRPSDTADKIDYEGLGRIARFAALLTRGIANLDTAPDFVKVAPKMESGGGRDTVRAFTGTIPDYTSEVEGLRLSGVIGGGPAEEAGLQEGDVIVEFAGLKIANIYDYTYALDAVKIGQPVKVIFLRDGERQEATIVPRARN